MEFIRVFNELLNEKTYNVEKLIKLLKDFMKQEILTLEQENTIKEFLIEYRREQKKVATEIDEILKTL